MAVMSHPRPPKPCSAVSSRCFCEDLLAPLIPLPVNSPHTGPGHAGRVQREQAVLERFKRSLLFTVSLLLRQTSVFYLLGSWGWRPGRIFYLGNFSFLFYLRDSYF